MARNESNPYLELFEGTAEPVSSKPIVKQKASSNPYYDLFESSAVAHPETRLTPPAPPLEEPSLAKQWITKAIHGASSVYNKGRDIVSGLVGPDHQVQGIPRITTPITIPKDNGPMTMDTGIDGTSVKSNLTGDIKPFQIKIEVPKTAQERTVWGNIKESLRRGNLSTALDTLGFHAAWEDDTGEAWDRDVKPLLEKYGQLSSVDPVKAKSWLGNQVYQAINMAPGMAKGAGSAAIGGALAGAVNPLAAPAGATVGGLQYWTRQGAGQVYNDLRLEGVNHQIAKYVATSIGPIYAKLEDLQVKGLAPKGTFSLMRQGLTRTLARNLTTILANRGKIATEQALQEAAQQALQETAKETAKWLDPEAKKSTGAQAAINIAKESLNAFAQSLGPMAIMGLPGAAIESNVALKSAQRRSQNIKAESSAQTQAPTEETPKEPIKPQQAQSQRVQPQAPVMPKQLEPVYQDLKSRVTQPALGKAIDQAYEALLTGQISVPQPLVQNYMELMRERIAEGSKVKPLYKGSESVQTEGIIVPGGESRGNQKNVQGIPGQEPLRQEPVQTQPEQGRGQEAVSGGRVFQAEGQPRVPLDDDTRAAIAEIREGEGASKGTGFKFRPEGGEYQGVPSARLKPFLEANLGKPAVEKALRHIEAGTVPDGGTILRAYDAVKSVIDNDIVPRYRQEEAQAKTELTKVISEAPDEWAMFMEAPDDLVLSSVPGIDRSVSAKEIKEALREIQSTKASETEAGKVSPLPRGGEPQPIPTEAKQTQRPVEPVAQETKSFVEPNGKTFEQTQQQQSVKEDLKRKFEAEQKRVEEKLGSKGQEPLTAEKAPLFAEAAGTQKEMFSEDESSQAPSKSAPPRKEKKPPYERPHLKRINLRLPELLRLYKALTGDKLPVLLKNIRNRSTRGSFTPNESYLIKLRRDLMKGNVLETINSKSKPDKKVVAENYAEKHGIKPEDVIVDVSWDKKSKEYVATIYDKDIFQAAKTFAHEIGHLIDYLGDEETMARGNVLGRIASFNKYLKTMLEPFFGAKPGILTAADRARLRKDARKILRAERVGGFKTITEIVPIYSEAGVTPEMIKAIWNDMGAKAKYPKLAEFISRLKDSEKVQIVKQAMKGLVDERLQALGGGEKIGEKEVTHRVSVDDNISEKEISDKLEKLIADEVEKRQLFELEVIRDELMRHTKEWRPYTPGANANFDKYRSSPEELYADGLSALLTDPETLQRNAPTFYRAIENWMDQKPDFKEVYDQITKDLESGKGPEKISQEFQEMLKRAEETRRESFLEEANRKSKHDVITTVKYYLASRSAYLIKLVRGTPKGDKALRMVNELKYLSSEVNNLAREYSNQVLKPLVRAGVEASKLDEYLFYKRTEREREHVFNPGMVAGETSTEQIAYLKQELGDEGFTALESAARKFRELRKKYVIDELEKLGVYDQKIMDIIKNTNDYVTFSVVKYINDNYGGAEGATIKKVVGTIDDIRAPFTATLLKDASMLRMARRSATAKSVVDSISENAPDEAIKAQTKRVEGGREIILDHSEADSSSLPDNFDPREMGTIYFMQNGKMQAYYVDKTIADLFVRDEQAINKFLKTVYLINDLFKDVYVRKNPGWLIWNMPRDFMRSFLNLPTGGFLEWTKAWMSSVPDAWNDVMLNESTEVVKELKANRGLLTARNYGTEVDADTEWERLVISYGIEAHRTKNIFKRIAQFVDDLGQVSDRITKIAAAKLLKKKNIPMDEIVEFVNDLAGTPNVMEGGKWRPIVNFFFMFSNVNIQGIRGDWKAFKKNKTRYAFWTMMLSAPSIFMSLAAKGFFSDDDDDKLERIFSSVPSWVRSAFLVIPVGMTKRGTLLYIPIPKPFTNVLIDSLIVNAIDKKSNTDKFQDSFKAFAQAFPMSHVNPGIGMAVDIAQWLQGRSPIDDLSRRPAIDQEVMDAGPERSAPELGKYLWNRMFGTSVYRFKTQAKEGEPSALQAIHSIPGLGPFASRFLRETDAGVSEKAQREVFGPLKRERAKASLDVKDTIRSSVKGGIYKGVNVKSYLSDPNLQAQAKEEVDSVYRDLVASGKINPENKSRREFANQYGLYLYARLSGKTGLAATAMQADSKEKMIALLKSMDTPGLGRQIFSIKAIQRSLK